MSQTLLVLLFLVTPLQASAFHGSCIVSAWQQVPALGVIPHGCSVSNNCARCFATEENREVFGDDGIDDDNDEEEIIKPYGNRSLAWTKRYRKLNPYEKVRERVLRFGHRSKEDWDECIASGQQGAYVPSHPDQMYAPEWVSWDEFLGLMRSYEETRHIAVNVLNLKTFDEYILFVRQNPHRAEGLRIPLRPDLKYKEQWIDEEHFFGNDEKDGN